MESWHSSVHYVELAAILNYRELSLRTHLWMVSGTKRCFPTFERFIVRSVHCFYDLTPISGFFFQFTLKIAFNLFTLLITAFVPWMWHFYDQDSSEWESVAKSNSCQSTTTVSTTLKNSFNLHFMCIVSRQIAFHQNDMNACFLLVFLYYVCLE